MVAGSVESFAARGTSTDRDTVRESLSQEAVADAATARSAALAAQGELVASTQQEAAVATRAAGLQGKFWEYSDAIAAAAPLSGHADFPQAQALAIARQVGVPDIAKFTADLASPDLVAAVTADTSQGQQLGITSTPFFVINTTAISGAQPTENFIQVIESYGAKK